MTNIMTRIMRLPALIATVLACALPAGPAAAQSNRTFVSSTGNDANACSLAAPCRTMQAAFNVTNPDGEINVLDPGGYGSLTITHAVSIEGHGWASMNVANGGTVITIMAGTADFVALRGLILEGSATGITDGIAFRAGGMLDVDDCVIRNFRIGLVVFAASSTLRLFVSNTHLIGNTDDGIDVEQFGGNVIAALRRVWSEGNGANGVMVFAQSSGPGITPPNVTLIESELSGNGTGVLNSGAAAFLTVQESNIVGNTSGVVVNSAGTIRISRSTVTGNQTGLIPSNIGPIQSYIDNNVSANGSNGAATTSLQYR